MRAACAQQQQILVAPCRVVQADNTTVEQQIIVAPADIARQKAAPFAALSFSLLQHHHCQGDQEAQEGLGPQLP